MMPSGRCLGDQPRVPMPIERAGQLALVAGVDVEDRDTVALSRYEPDAAGITEPRVAGELGAVLAANLGVLCHQGLFLGWVDREGHDTEFRILRLCRREYLACGVHAASPPLSLG